MTAKTPNVGDKLTVSLTLTCTHDREPLRLDDGIADVSDVDEGGARKKLGNLGGGLAGGLVIEVYTADGKTVGLYCAAKDQWLAITAALRERYGFEPGGTK
jgi:hypothetical protein